MTESQTTGAGGKTARFPEYDGTLGRFYRMLDDEKYDELVHSLSEYHSCAVGTRLGLEDMPGNGAYNAMRRYDEDLFRQGKEVFEASKCLIDQITGEERYQTEDACIKDVRARLDRIAAHEIDHERLRRAIKAAV